jgi:hypothetical protein
LDCGAFTAAFPAGRPSQTDFGKQDPFRTTLRSTSDRFTHLGRVVAPGTPSLVFERAVRSGLPTTTADIPLNQDFTAKQFPALRAGTKTL